MDINDFVIVTKESSELYRRRCQIKAINDDKYTVYSEGLEEQDVLLEGDLMDSKY